MTDEKIHFFLRLWRKIVEPNHEFEDPEERWRVEMINGIILTVTLLSVLFMFFFSIVNFSNIRPFEIGLFSATFLIIILPIVLNKKGFTKIALFTTLATFTIGISCMALLFRHPSEGLHLFIFFFIPIFIAQAIMKPVKAMLFSTVLILVQIFGPMILYGSEYLMPTLLIAIFLILSAFIVHLYVLYRQRQEVRTRASLEENEEKFRAIFDYSKDGICVADPATLRIITFNSAFRRMTGYTEKELHRMTIPDFHPTDMEKRLDDDLSDFRKYREKVSKDYTMMKNDGTIYFVDMRTTKVRYGKEIYMMGVFRDTTAQRNLEHQKEMRRRETEFFLDLFEHDIGNIHQAALLSLQMAKVSEGSNKALYIERSIRSINRALLLVRNIKEMKKVHGEEVATHEMDLVGIIDQAIRDVKHLHPEKKTRILFESGGRPITVRGNSFLVDVFINILDNAIKFDRDDSPLIEVRIRRQGDKKVLVEIWDKGPGVPESQRKAIFQRYSERLMKEVKGTGLGLSICREIITSVKGRIWVESRPDNKEGSVFKIELDKTA